MFCFSLQVFWSGFYPVPQFWNVQIKKTWKLRHNLVINFFSSNFNFQFSFSYIWKIKIIWIIYKVCQSFVIIWKVMFWLCRIKLQLNFYLWDVMHSHLLMNEWVFLYKWMLTTIFNTYIPEIFKITTFLMVLFWSAVCRLCELLHGWSVQTMLVMIYLFKTAAKTNMLHLWIHLRKKRAKDNYVMLMQNYINKRCCLQTQPISKQSTRLSAKPLVSCLWWCRLVFKSWLS